MRNECRLPFEPGTGGLRLGVGEPRQSGYKVSPRSVLASPVFLAPAILKIGYAHKTKYVYKQQK